MLVFPSESRNPPAFAVVEELDAVDAATFSFFVGGFPFVGAENLGDVAEASGYTVYFAFGETAFDEEFVAVVDVLPVGYMADA